MATLQAKENILQKIRQALVNPVPLPFPQSEGMQPFFAPAAEDNAVIFAEEFTKLQGQFAFCTSMEDLEQQLLHLLQRQAWQKVYCKEAIFISVLAAGDIQPYDDLAGCDVSVTGCEFLVARTGSIVLSAAQQYGRTASVYAPVHICVAYTSQLLYDVKDAMLALKEKYGNDLPSFITFASGPSRTADIEKTLVTGVHGPKEVYCFLMEG